MRYPPLAIIGLGYWGEKMLSILRRNSLRIHGYDIDPKRILYINHHYPEIHLHTSYREILADQSIQAVIVATPTHLHFKPAEQAIRAGKHVLIEKPMTQNLREADSLRDQAKRLKRIIMVDHTYMFSPALHEARRLIQNGSIGTVQRIESIRTNGRIVQGSTILWDFAPHDVAIALFLMERTPSAVRTLAEPKRTGVLLDDAVIEMSYANLPTRFLAHVSWTDPTKERALSIIGSSASLHIRWEGPTEKSILTKHGKTTIRKTSGKEPLEEMLLHFMTCIRRAHVPLSNGDIGYDVVKIISLLHTSWQKGGKIIVV